ncbi:signal peptide peptidase SppA [Phyllobacterium leguminum]|uniref:Signal peptide peptidase A n=1 Tax=Phyllobacterium leguminum TaxID=314237 RepID=A0A318TDP4_9HYPH|nr:signal peptide peptidase SppA [Phyllobacterium leguminum]PYE89366.1 signal peptide peptidase A [Phyllobacterium leguminum]
MTQSADAIIDRRRLRRKLTFWRIVALAVAALGIGLLADFTGLGGRNAPHIAKVKIEGPIHEDDDLLDRLDKIANNNAVKGLIISVDSPGGTTAGGEAIFNAVRKVAEKKPVVAQVGTLAASAGYMIASAADHIVARQTSIVGSIGVLFQYPDISQLLTKLGIKIETIKSSPLKAEPNFFSPAPEEAKAMIRNMIMDSYDWFVGLVEKRRGFDHEQALALANGAVFTGRQALDKKLIDQLGGEDEAVGWLKGKGTGGTLPVVEWMPQQKGIIGSLFSQSAARLLIQVLGVPENGGSLLLREAAGERLFTPSLLSAWPAEGARPEGQ